MTWRALLVSISPYHPLHHILEHLEVMVLRDVVHHPQVVRHAPAVLAALEQAAADASPSQVAHLDLAVARAPQVLQLGRRIKQRCVSTR